MDILLIGLVALIGYSEYFIGTPMVQRPIVMGALTGLVLGDLQQGLILGAAIELVFMGVASIGAAIPPEVTAGGILGTAFAINSGAGAEVALALALPIATVGLLCKNSIYIFIRPLLNHKADRYAEEGNIKGVGRMHLLSTLIFVISMSAIVMISYALGSSVVNEFLEMIPSFITEGFQIAAGLLPAVGFALLLRMILNKSVVHYFILGFALVAYLNIPVMGIAIFGLVMAIIAISLMNKKSENQEAIADDDF
ncbi:PTS mannose/fructose/sorbose/N-acetylgalactosamine transporter subunit IIC [Trichococcus flocculiformis]|uniref:PTS mannose/fructose/sorbose/N-acetylgalactosamine transporter subunit IIC n=1 Tax=Trichococcus flocculiformis TaxID=82803 RepID=UPI003DA46965